MAYEWQAHYTGGERLLQIEAGGNKNAYYDIDQERLASFQLWEGNRRVFAQEFKPGERLIWRRRTEMHPGGEPSTCHIVGKRGVDGHVDYVACIFEDDGRVIVSDKFDDSHPWLYPPQYQEHEL